MSARIKQQNLKRVIKKKQMCSEYSDWIPKLCRFTLVFATLTFTKFRAEINMLLDSTVRIKRGTGFCFGLPPVLRHFTYL
jgi:hypothetical protein